MMFSEKQIKALQEPLHRSHVKGRSQGGRQVSYIEGWHAIDEANRIFGFDGWDRETVDLRQLCEPYTDQKNNFRVSYMARVRIRVRPADPSGDTAAGPTEDIIRDGCGYGSGIDRDLGAAHESAIKEAETDAMKRALMTFGNPFGLALYDKEQRNVADEAPELPAELQTQRAAHSAKSAFIKGTKIIIRNAQDATELREWWNSADQKEARRQHGLDQSEADELKQMVIDRCKELEKSLHPMEA